ncbi:cell wall integrity and stress response component 4, partial [Biomphalaria glabrata]
HQLDQGYKCGVCGDPYDGEKTNEEGGMYATGQISRTYEMGQLITIQVEITSNHLGYCEFKLCPKTSRTDRTTQDCLDRYPLALADGSGYKYKLSRESKLYSVDVFLPAGLTCDFCVLQWRYHTGNSWGEDPNGVQCVGCGPQEEFYGCADVRIIARDSQSNGQPASSLSYFVPAQAATQTFTKERLQGLSQAPNETPTQNSLTQSPTSSPTQARGSIKMGSTKYFTQASNSVNYFENAYGCRSLSRQPELDFWCKVNCWAGNCPASHCWCSIGLVNVCSSNEAFSGNSDIDQWCATNCAMGYCPAMFCACV